MIIIIIFVISTVSFSDPFHGLRTRIKLYEIESPIVPWKLISGVWLLLTDRSQVWILNSSRDLSINILSHLITFFFVELENDHQYVVYILILTFGWLFEVFIVNDLNGTTCNIQKTNKEKDMKTKESRKKGKDKRNLTIIAKHTCETLWIIYIIIKQSNCIKFNDHK